MGGSTCKPGRRVRAVGCASMLGCIIVMHVHLSAGSTRPYYTRRMPAVQNEADFTGDSCRIDLRKAHLPPYPDDPGILANYDERYDARAAAIIRAAAGPDIGLRIFDDPDAYREDDAEERKAKALTLARNLLEKKVYGEDAPEIQTTRAKVLALMAYPDYFPNTRFKGIRAMVSRAILAASPGWVGTFGPGVDGLPDLLRKFHEGNYDMTQMHLLPLAYRYYDELSPEAREHLIMQLLGRGRIHRPRVDDTLTSGGTPDDWSRAGFISPFGNHRNISETENHQLMIITARYLTNQLLYQRDPAIRHDNRRNGGNGRPHTIDIVLYLLRNILRGDFSEYNAKNYQQETRWAVLNLATYAYDDNVRLAARMVLDYLSARMAVTSNDLRRMVPFRRRNEPPKARTVDGFMDVGLIDWQSGADPMLPYFALRAGNTRALEKPIPADHKDREHLSALACGSLVRPHEWTLAYDGNEMTIEAMTDYRLPPSIHDLFVNDPHRRFFQRLRRVPRQDENRGNRNCDHMEINAGSPSYLITAGGKPCGYAIDPNEAAIFQPDEALKQVGVAVPTSFMPTTRPDLYTNDSLNLIQFSSFSDEAQGVVVPRNRATVRLDPLNTVLPAPLDLLVNLAKRDFGVATMNGVANYCVAPDFACGHRVYLPPWVTAAATPPTRGFSFVDKGSAPSRPGFYLALYRQGEYALMEAFDTWLHPGVTFDQFRERVLKTNSGLDLRSNVESQYVTQNGNRVRFVIWTNGERESALVGAKVLAVDYGNGDQADRLGDAGNVTNRLLNGTILNSPAEAVIEIRNPFLGTTILLDMSDHLRPRRVSETGEVEVAGANHEVWVDFDWRGATEGDFYRPFNTMAAAVAAVADGGVIKVAPASSKETVTIRTNKRIKVVAPIGGVTIGSR